MIAVYELATGDIRRYVTCPREDYDINVGEGESCIEVGAPTHAHARVVDGRMEEVAAVTLSVSYSQQRRAEYPPIGDQLDAIWKALAQLDSSVLPAESVSVLDQIVAIKARHPKP
ncbi:hypothetical protein ACQ4P5_20165 [Ralstonia sp. L16]|uniref:hypothetical protein n=1 Tax=Ralstonia sp. L16 TaxID=3423950 RepID=UPI003F7AEB6B